MRTTLSLRLVAAVSAVLMPFCAAAGEASKPLGVVELFTSQGCNSCPPADAVLADLVKSGDVVALGYHVDYWDYLGWRDTLSRPEFTERQYDYGKSFGTKSVYTPQAVINGRSHVNGSKAGLVQAALNEYSEAGEGLSVDIKVTQTETSLIIETGGSPANAGNANLVLVSYEPQRDIVIERGENKGKTIAYMNPVTDIQTVGMWHGRAARYELPAAEIKKKGNCAILLQTVTKDGFPGPIIGAAQADLGN